jgi:hypothetical protein
MKSVINHFLAVGCVTALLTGCNNLKSEDPIPGSWKWESEVYQCGNEKCKMYGTMLVRPFANNSYLIDLNAFQKSGYISDNSYRTITSAEQSCEAPKPDNEIKISCRVIRANPNYLPDNFELTYNKGELIGKLTSINPVSVKFRK